MRITKTNILLDSLPVLSVFTFAAMAFLPFAHKFGYYNDDWYLIYAGISQGSQAFMDIFAIDRPFRGYFVGWMFDLLGVNAPLYSYSAYIIRCMGALGVMWIARMVWPQEKMASLLLGLICVIYPGFLDQPNAIDYQSHIWAFTLAIASIGFSLQAMQSGLARWQRVAWILLAVSSQVIALLLMEYYIGLEGLRLLLMWVTARRLNMKILRERPGLPVGYWLPYLLGAAGFMVWRQFIFQNQRTATDIAGMVSGLLNSPVRRFFTMALSMVQDWLNVIFYAWAVPPYRLAFNLSLKNSAIAFGLMLAAVLLAWAILAALDRQNREERLVTGDRKTGLEMAVVGFLALTAALLPVQLGGRQVVFESFSRFSLTASIGAGLVLVGFWREFLHSSKLRRWFPAILIGLGVLVHTANSIQHVERWNVTRNFWWQVSWRVPQFQPGTVILADYAGYGIAEDYFIWGPASLIYETQPDQKGISQPLSAATLDKRDIIKVIGQEIDSIDRRGIVTDKNYARVVVLSLSKPTHCVHVLDENYEVSSQERVEIISLASYSHVEQINPQGIAPVPPVEIFGQEPPHGWCYYYQKASLARQRQDWEEVVRLGEEIRSLGLQPDDPIDWMPFILAYAFSQRADPLSDLLPEIQDSPFLSMQACKSVIENTFQASVNYPWGYKTLTDELCALSK